MWDAGEFCAVFCRRKLRLIFRNIRYIHLVAHLLATVVRGPLVEKCSSMSLTIAVVWNCLTSWKWNSMHLHKATCVYSIPLGRNRFSFPVLAGFLFYYTSSSVKLGIKMNLATFGRSFGNVGYRLVTSSDWSRQKDIYAINLDNHNFF